MRDPGYRLSVTNLLLFSGRYPDDEIMSVFREEDRSVFADGRSYYACAVGHLCDRLDAMGFRLRDAQEQVGQFAKQAGNPFYVIARGDSDGERRARERIEAEECLLRTTTFEQWRDTYIRLITEWNENGELSDHPPKSPFESLEDGATGSESEGDNADGRSSQPPEVPPGSGRGQLDEYFYQFSSEDSDAPIVGIRSPFRGCGYEMRAMLSAFDRDAIAWLDFTRLITEELINPNLKLREVAIENLLAPARATEPIVVLTEGSTDTRILSQSLRRLFPHLCTFYTFLDHEGFAPPSGTGNIANLIKGLAASGISNRVIAVFDNDAAGTVAALAARDRRFPKNFRILQLPYLQRGKQYPTLGPTGAVTMDINGSACSLELYLGTAALTADDGALLPILWTGYEWKLSRYQGALSNKLHAQKKYLERLTLSPDPIRDPEFDDMRAVLRAIMNAFAI